MSYKFEKELRKRALEFISSLEKSSVKGDICEDSFRDYTVKVSIVKDGVFYGNVNLYYSPRKDIHTMKTHELRDKSIVSELENSWYGKTIVSEVKNEKGYHIYVDGSYFNGIVGYGLVILKDGKVIKECSGSVSEKDACGTHQVAGELVAAGNGITWCRENDVKEVSIFYDYEGIEKWATGEWQTKQDFTRRYKEFIQKCSVRISWHKVDSHRGNRWNERADRLAKKGTLNIKP